MRWLRRLRPAAAERARPQAEPMEPRLLFSADLTGGLLLGADVGAGAAAEHRTLTESGEYASLAAESAAATPESSAATVAAYAQLPLAFEQNQGQADVGIDFLAQGSGYGIALANGNAVLNFNTDLGQHTVGLELVGARPSEGVGEGQLQGYSNYLVGNEAAKWFTGIANHAAVLYQDVYDGIDLRYYGNQQQLEYDFIVGAGAAEGVAEGDGPAVRVRLLGGEAELLLPGQHHRGEGLVDLDEVDVVDGHAGPGQRLAGRLDRAEAHDLGVHARHARRDRRPPGRCPRSGPGG